MEREINGQITHSFKTIKGRGPKFLLLNLLPLLQLDSEVDQRERRSYSNLLSPGLLLRAERSLLCCL